MSLENRVETLVQCTKQLGPGNNVVATLDEGMLLLHQLTSERELCTKVAEKLTGFGDLLATARDSDKEMKTVLQKHISEHLNELPTLKGRLEEWSVQELVQEIRKLNVTLETVDMKTAARTQALDRLETCARSVDLICEKHGRTKTLLGRLFLATGCLALTVCAASILLRIAAHTSGNTVGRTKALFLRLTPWNTGLAGGLVTILGVGDTSHSELYSKMTLDFRDFADDVRREVTASRSFRTRIQKLRHALNDLELALHVTTGVNAVEAHVWTSLIDWIPILSTALKQLDPGIVS